MTSLFGVPPASAPATAYVQSLLLAASTGSSLVGHIAPGANAVATTLQAILRRAVTVQEYGAVADGKYAGGGTPNATAFDYAVLAAWKASNVPGSTDSYGGAVYIPGGLYALERIVYIPPHMTVFGDGMYNSLLVGSSAFTSAGLIRTSAINANFPLITAAGGNPAGAEGNPSTIRDIGVITSSGGSGAGATGIYADLISTYIKAVWVSGYLNYGVVLAREACYLSQFATEFNTYGIGLFADDCTVVEGEFNANNGAHIVVNNNPTYVAQAGSSNTITLPTTFSAVDSAIVGWNIAIVGGTGSGSGRVTAYVGATRVATITPNWVSAPAAGTLVTLEYAAFGNTIANCRLLPGSCTSGGLYIFDSKRIQITNLDIGLNSPGGVASPSTSYQGGAVVITNGVDISINNLRAVGGRSGDGANSTIDGVTVNNNSNGISTAVTITGGNVSNWRNGIVLNSSQNVGISNLICTGNKTRGAYLNGGDQITVQGGSYSNNGVTGVGGIGIESQNFAGTATHIISGVQANGLGGNLQATGIKANLTGTGQTIIGGGTVALYNATKNLDLTASGSGSLARVYTQGTLTELGMKMGLPSTTQIINRFSQGGLNAPAVGTPASALEVLSGALTAGVLSAAIINLTGAGQVSFLSVYVIDTTTRDIRIQVTVDGTIAFDATATSVGIVGNGIRVIGNGINSSQASSADAPLVYNSSLVVKISSSLTETNLLGVGYNLRRN